MAKVLQLLAIEKMVNYQQGWQILRIAWGLNLKKKANDKFYLYYNLVWNYIMWLSSWVFQHWSLCNMWLLSTKKKKKKLAKLVARKIEETYKLSIDDFPKKKNKKQKLFDTSCGP